MHRQRINEMRNRKSCCRAGSSKRENKMKSLKKLAGMIGLVILLCGIMTGCSGKRLYSEEELTQIHDVVGAVEQITK